MDGERKSVPLLCSNGCGFYSGPNTEGLCSKCFKEFMKNKKFTGNGSANANSSINTAGTVATAEKKKVAESVRMQPMEASANVAVETREKTLNSLTDSSTVDSNKACKTIESNSTTAIESLNKATASLSIATGAKSKDCKIPSIVVSPCDGSEVKIRADQEDRNRCEKCRKKLGLTAFTCRCGGIYCAIHRYSDKHSCTFDYKAQGAEQIKRENPLITIDKVTKF